MSYTNHLNISQHICDLLQLWWANCDLPKLLWYTDIVPRKRSDEPGFQLSIGSWVTYLNIQALMVHTLSLRSTWV